MKNSAFLTLLVILFFGARLSGQVIFVKSGASGNNDGTSWANAYTELYAALAAATPTSEIWVATGTYKPDATTPNNSFAVLSGIRLYGGFAGTETSLTQRNIAANPTVLSGDLLGDDVAQVFTSGRADNSLHLLMVSGDQTVNTIIDGFAVKGGTSSTDTNAPDFNQRGGGLLAVTPVTVRNCVFSDNYGGSGASVACLDASANGVIIDNCIFELNEATQQSAGVYMRSINGAEVNKCIFRNNVTNRGTLYPRSCKNLVVDSCLFLSNNSGANFCGGFYNWQSSFTMTYCQFESNAGANAAGMYNDGRDGGNFFSLDHVAFIQNSTTGFGGAGMYNYKCSFQGSNLHFSGNSAANGASMYTSGGSIYTVSNSLFEGNSATFAGGFTNYSAGTVGTFQDCQFIGNAAVTSGGVATNGFLATLNLNNCLFEQNTAKYGGVVYNQNDTTSLYVDGCTFKDNVVANNGGALNLNGGISASIKNSEFTTNSAATGGAINFSDGDNDKAYFNVENTIFQDNVASTQGAGVNISGVTSLITGSLFKANLNVGTGAGGAISNNAGGEESSIKVVNSTFVDNLAPIGAGIAQWEDDTSNAILTVQNCIFFDSGNSYEIEAGQPDVYTGGGNSVNDGSFAAYLTGTNDASSTDPLFIDYVQGNFQLQANSPCIDKGLWGPGVLAVDIEGSPRIGAPDKGCYESPFGVGVQDARKVEMIRLIPNPTVQWVEATLKNDYTGDVQYEIYAADGKSVGNFSAVKTNENFILRHDCANLNNGVYSIAIKMGKSQYTGMFVKN